MGAPTPSLFLSLHSIHLSHPNYGYRVHTHSFFFLGSILRDFQEYTVMMSGPVLYRIETVHCHIWCQRCSGWTETLL
jgi:hypothetical protein